MDEKELFIDEFICDFVTIASLIKLLIDIDI
jgi:hypothetical protein